MRRISILLCLAVLVLGVVSTASAQVADQAAQVGQIKPSGGGESSHSEAPTPVPEPVTIALLGGGLVGLYGLKKKLGQD